jgi:ABC-type branched-subunit amino acid transport system ATPase component
LKHRGGAGEHRPEFLLSCAAPLSVSVLEALDISVEFAGLRALDGVSLRLEPGEILGLIGPNGSGKTTLVNVLTGQLRPTAGRVLCNGEDITGLSPPQIAARGVARSFQIVRLFRNLTVRENVEAGAIARGLGRPAARTVADRLLAAFDLEPRATAFAGSLSYGDERRIEIARALATAPTFLLLDEPAAGMNEAETARLLELLAELPKAERLGILIIDHDMPLIMRLSHRLHVLASGRTIAEGDVPSVQRSPEVIAAYLGSAAADA